MSSFVAVKTTGMEAVDYHNEHAETPGYFENCRYITKVSTRFDRPEGRFYLMTVCKRYWLDPEFFDYWVVLVREDGEIAEMTVDLSDRRTVERRYNIAVRELAGLSEQSDARAVVRELSNVLAELWRVDAE